ncbi:MAG: tetratricopeptide repeat protein [Ideonella sp.]|nr:tetratricopeptide repeat protein [Ideonella sp.]MCC7457317.1 tetratricopeptide repeat protein [Nitrospira sp.]
MNNKAKHRICGEPVLRLLGSPEFHAPGAPPFAPERRFQLLAVLGVRSGQWVARDELAALLWPGHANADARRNLRHVVFKARELPGVDGLEASEHALRWAVATDLLAFEQALHDGCHREAMAWRRGPLLDGLDGADNSALAEWVAHQRTRVEALWQGAAHRALAAADDAQQRCDIAQQLLAVDPLDEAAVAGLLEARVALGDVAGARAVFRTYAHRLAEMLGVEPSRRLRQLLGAADPGAPAALPVDDAAFVGRRVELAALTALFERSGCRLVTLVGPGGIGKSRLALQALERIALARGLESVVIELHDLDSAAAATTRLAQRLGISLADAGDAIACIARGLGARRLCCVLDNAEHLPDLAPWLERLLAAAPRVVALVTSRAQLGIAAEAVLALQGLPVPDEDSRDLDAAGAFDAVRLFQVRAAAALPGFDLAAHLGAVLDIVDAVAGMPLAIELAAAWVRLLPPHEIARELRDSLDLLERDPAAASAPARPEHRSMRVVLERSWGLLAPREREALAALSVFDGGFTPVAALGVARAPAPLLSSLADKSMLNRDAQGRFGLHPLIAVDAAERLNRDPEQAQACRARHVAYHAALADALVGRAAGDPMVVVAGLETELANCRLAWRRAIDADMAGPLAQSVQAWRIYFDRREQPAHGVVHFRQAIAAGLVLAWPPALMARLRAGLSRLLCRQGDFDNALATARAGIESARLGDDRRALASCLVNAGSSHSGLGQLPAAQRLFEEALAVGRDDGAVADTAAALRGLGTVALKQLRHAEALAVLGEALEIDRSLGAHAEAARCLYLIAGVHQQCLHWVLARQVMTQGLDVCERHGLDAMALYFLFGLGAVLLELGEPAEAEQHLHRALDACRVRGNPFMTAGVEANLARIAVHRGDCGLAWSLLRAAARAARSNGWSELLLLVTHVLGECSAAFGRPRGAARLWQTVIAHPAALPSARDKARACAEALPLSDPERTEALRRPLAIDELIECLLEPGDRAEAGAALHALTDRFDRR